MKRLIICLFITFIAFANNASAADSATYTYDKLGRIVVVTYANGTAIGYGYDAQGNRYAIAISCSGSGC